MNPRLPDATLVDDDYEHPGRCATCGDPLAWTGSPGSSARIHAWRGRLGLPDRPYEHQAQPTTDKAVA